MTKLNRATFETFNADEDARAAKHLRKPRYYAVEVDGDPGVFQCPAKDNLFSSESQLREWATAINCEWIIIRWIPGGQDEPGA